ncbi:MAG TPA: DUF3422 domain-containing protein [Sphingomicrobium sp.]|nr:DUF3422 domain-containing protein [Sphingomicrobium sp.]
MRAALTQEMHVRRLPPIRIPAHVLQIVALFGEDGADEAERHISAIPGCEAPPPGARYHRCRIGDVELVWERHTEFCTYTFVSEGRTEPLFSQQMFDNVDRSWLQAIPGVVIRASHLVLVRDEGDADHEALAANFSEDSLVCCDLAGGAARMYSDFQLHPDGNGRLLVVDRGLRGVEPSQLLRRLLELGNYRKMALLGLPVAQSGMVQLDRLESRLANLTTSVANAGAEPRSLLEELTSLSAEIARLSTETQYRMSASNAYGQLVEERLAALRVEPIRGYLTLADFTERRLLPALRTCASFASRLNDLAGRAEWTSALMRTRIETALTAQNRDLLASMDRRASIQLRLQQTVEGLSVVAISYYAVGLLGYAAGPFLEAYGINSHWLNAAAVPLTLAGTWMMLRFIRRRWTSSDSVHSDPR